MLLGEGEGKEERKARIRQIMHELGNQGLGARHHLTGGWSPSSRAFPRWVLVVGKLSKVLCPWQHLEEGRHSVLLWHKQLALCVAQALGSNSSQLC